MSCMSFIMSFRNQEYLRFGSKNTQNMLAHVAPLPACMTALLVFEHLFWLFKASYEHVPAVIALVSSHGEYIDIHTS